MDIKLKKDKGVTLIELLIALVISGILIAALYRGFIGQQKTYTVQEQVADMQQNVRVAINKMVREIRMAGFGGKNENTNGNNDIITVFGNVNGFANIINPVNDITVDGITHDQIAVIAAYRQVGTLAADVVAGTNSFSINYNSGVKFDNDNKKYVCLNGRNNYAIIPTSGSSITLGGGATFNENHSSGEPVFLVEAITYELGMNSQGIPVLYRNTNTGGPKQPVAENIENLQFEYFDAIHFDANGNPLALSLPIADPKIIRMVKVTVTARTSMNDPDYKGGVGGFRRRTVISNIQIRNR